MKTIFKVGDKVFHYTYGWGEILYIYPREDEYHHPVKVEFDNDIYFFTEDGKYSHNDLNPTLSFTEYTLQGFSQEKPIKLPEVGELCLVRDDTDEDWSVVEFKEYDPSRPLPFIDKNDEGFKYMKRIKILD